MKPAQESEATVEPDRPGIQRSVQRNWWRGGYARLLISQAVSTIGDRISYVVVPFCLLLVGVSASGIAIVLAARAVGYALVVLHGGVLADRANRTPPGAERPA